MKKYKVGIIGATGMVGQRFTLLLENHPWFEVTVLAASKRSAGKTYGETVEGRWHMTAPLPEKYKDMVIVDAENVEEVASQVDFCFCAVNMKKDEIRDLEDRYAKAECPIVSNNSAHRFTDDVPMVIPEINADHIKIIDAQRKRLGTKRGFVAVKSNCSLQSYVPAIHPLKALGVDKVLACTYQAISGAGKTFKTWPEMVDNVIPYIGGGGEKKRGGNPRRCLQQAGRHHQGAGGKVFPRYAGPRPAGRRGPETIASPCGTSAFGSRRPPGKCRVCGRQRGRCGHGPQRRSAADRRQLGLPRPRETGNCRRGTHRGHHPAAAGNAVQIAPSDKIFS